LQHGLDAQVAFDARQWVMTMRRAGDAPPLITRGDGFQAWCILLVVFERLIDRNASQRPGLAAHAAMTGCHGQQVALFHLTVAQLCFVSALCSPF